MMTKDDLKTIVSSVKDGDDIESVSLIFGKLKFICHDRLKGMFKKRYDDFSGLLKLFEGQVNSLYPLEDKKARSGTFSEKYRRLTGSYKEILEKKIDSEKNPPIDMQELAADIALQKAFFEEQRQRMRRHALYVFDGKVDEGKKRNKPMLATPAHEMQELIQAVGETKEKTKELNRMNQRLQIASDRLQQTISQFAQSAKLLRTPRPPKKSPQTARRPFRISRSQETIVHQPPKLPSLNISNLPQEEYQFYSKRPVASRLTQIKEIVREVESSGRRGGKEGLDRETTVFSKQSDPRPADQEWSYKEPSIRTHKPARRSNPSVLKSLFSNRD